MAGYDQGRHDKMEPECRGYGRQSEVAVFDGTGLTAEPLPNKE